MRTLTKVGFLAFSLLALLLSSCDIVSPVDEIEWDDSPAELTAEDRCLLPWGGGRYTFPVTLSGNVDTLMPGTNMTVVASAGGVKVNHWMWFLNDRPIPRANKSSITIGAKLREGNYKLSVIADKGNRIGFAKCFFAVASLPPEPVSTFLEFDGASWTAPTTEGVPTFVPPEAIDVAFWLAQVNETSLQVRNSLALAEGGALFEWDGSAWVTPFSRQFPTAAPATAKQIVICVQDGAFLARCETGEWLQFDGSGWISPYTNHVPYGIPSDSIQIHLSLANGWYSLSSAGILSVYDLDAGTWTETLPAIPGAQEFVLKSVDQAELKYFRLSDGSFMEADATGTLFPMSLSGVPTSFPEGTIRVLTLHFDGHFFALVRN